MCLIPYINIYLLRINKHNHISHRKHMQKQNLYYFHALISHHINCKSLSHFQLLKFSSQCLNYYIVTYIFARFPGSVALLYIRIRLSFFLYSYEVLHVSGIVCLFGYLGDDLDPVQTCLECCLVFMFLKGNWKDLSGQL
jgi:hypothetical protein